MLKKQFFLKFWRFQYFFRKKGSVSVLRISKCNFWPKISKILRAVTEISRYTDYNSKPDLNWRWELQRAWRTNLTNGLTWHDFFKLFDFKSRNDVYKKWEATERDISLPAIKKLVISNIWNLTLRSGMKVDSILAIKPRWSVNAIKKQSWFESWAWNT